MNKQHFSLRAPLGTALLVLALLLAGPRVAFEQEPVPGFPASHQELLGASSYRAYFGLDATPVPFGPSSPPGGKGKPPRIGPNTVVNAPQFPFPNGLLGRSETTVAADTSNRSLLVGWNDADGFCGPPFNVGCVPAIPTGPGLSGFGWSTDGGATWTDGGAPFPVVTPGGTKVTRGDPVVDTGGPGKNTFYYANLAVDTTTSSPGLGGMTVHTGGFSQGSFAFTNGVFLASPNAPRDFLDKEWLCAGKTSAFKDEVTVSVSNFIEVAGIPFFGFGQIEIYGSTDRAASFPLRTIVQPDETISVPLNQGIVNQGSNCAYGPNGELYVVWERGWLSPFFGQGAAGVWPHIAFAASFDGGATFGPRQLVSDISSASLFPPFGYNRGNHNDFPRMCVATKDDDPFRGRAYVVYQDSRVANGGPQAVTGGFGNRDADVYLTYSDDSGVTWSAPTLVAGGGDGNIQFWPAVKCNQSDGDVDVIWYEQIVASPLVDVYYARSTDGGNSFATPLRVTSVSTNWAATATNIRPNFGDYIDLYSNSNRVHVTWADGRNGVPDSFYSQVKTN